MGIRSFQGNGAGVGVFLGCGFGIGAPDGALSANAALPHSPPPLAVGAPVMPPPRRCCRMGLWRDAHRRGGAQRGRHVRRGGGAGLGPGLRHGYQGPPAACRCWLGACWRTAIAGCWRRRLAAGGPGHVPRLFPAYTEMIAGSTPRHNAPSPARGAPPPPRPPLPQYINISPEFLEGRTHRPNVFKQVQYAVKRLTEHGRPPAAVGAAQS